MIWIGTSGWQFRDWRGPFYPETLPQSRWLEFYAARFQTVEVNNTFYRLPAPEVFAAWRAATPADFRVVAKLSRFLSHMKRLRDPEEPVRRFLAHAAPLGDRLGPVLLQLPTAMTCDRERLEHFLAVWPPEPRLAIELRHPSWFAPEIFALLSRHRVALCLTDIDGRPHQPLVRTADWGYVRLHRGRAAPLPCYGDRPLRAWAERITDLWSDRADVFVYFNNDPHACAVRDAARFALHVDHRHRARTRAPAPRDIDLDRTPRRHAA
ncbi:MAG TPA: DUF72 domain-containing protein [Nannocystis sp.]